MIPKQKLALTAALMSLVCVAQSAPAQLPKMVAYDAKDKRYYSVEYAKAHQMHDKGGDLLIVIPSAQLPKEAKLSRAMHGKI